ncbi:MAG: hypothetical protein Q4D33_00370, partial [Prevotellaceae bacterium]|nr:hypothetical protein [Prevotellaceae bacterium]
AISTPYNCGFESSDDFNSCWIKMFEAEGTWAATPQASAYMPTSTTSYYHTGSNAASVYGYYYQADQTSRSTPQLVRMHQLFVH